MIWWVTVHGKYDGEDRVLYFVVEANTELDALSVASTRLGYQMLDSVTNVTAIRSNFDTSTIAHES